MCSKLVSSVRHSSSTDLFAGRMSDNGRLAGKCAVVTAAAQGIGKATCLMFAKEGCKVIATDINEQLLKDLEKHEGITTRRLDVTNRGEVEALAKDLDAVDILFNCAGYVHQGTILDCEEDIWDKSFDVNVKSMYFMCKAFIPKERTNLQY